MQRVPPCDRFQMITWEARRVSRKREVEPRQYDKLGKLTYSLVFSNTEKRKLIGGYFLLA